MQDGDRLEFDPGNPKEVKQSELDEFSKMFLRSVNFDIRSADSFSNMEEVHAYAASVMNKVYEYDLIFLERSNFSETRADNFSPFSDEFSRAVRDVAQDIERELGSPCAKGFAHLSMCLHVKIDENTGQRLPLWSNPDLFWDKFWAQVLDQLYMTTIGERGITEKVILPGTGLAYVNDGENERIVVSDTPGDEMEIVPVSDGKPIRKQHRDLE